MRIAAPSSYCRHRERSHPRDDMKAYKKEVRDSLQQGVPGLKPKGMICDLKDLVVNTTSSVEIISYLHYDNGT